MANGSLKRMKVYLTIRQKNKGATYGREFQSCARMLKPGRGASSVMGEDITKRQAAVCVTAPSPRAAVRGALEKLAGRMGKNVRRGHKRFGRK